jgi:hypothetical protein
MGVFTIRVDRARCGPALVKLTIAVLQLLYTEANTVEWLFPQEKATLHDLGKGTPIGQPL